MPIPNLMTAQIKMLSMISTEIAVSVWFIALFSCLHSLWCLIQATFYPKSSL